MGEVYRATDERLGRDVAIKVLPDQVAGNPERLARFKREAQLLAALNHSGIAGIHGLEEVDGKPFLVLELVEGEDLKALIESGPMAPDRAIRIALQISQALEAAHARGIVHRDVKPSNVRVGRDDQVKVLDLGLAKALRPEAVEEGSRAPTKTIDETREGVILGTAPYMSPEHVRGESADTQTDIWAWACVFYELLAGRRAFPGKTRPDVFAAVLEREPDWDALPAATSPTVRSLLRRCLRKDRNRRLRDIADARIELEDLQDGPDELPPEPSRRRSVVWTALGAASISGVVALAVGLWAYSAGGRRPKATVSRFVIAPPDGLRIPDSDSLALSNDGFLMAFVAGKPGAGRRIYLRTLGEFEARALPGTEGGTAPFFSPDGERLGFHGAGGAIRTVAVDGGPVTTLAEAGTPVMRATLWNSDGIVFPSGNIVGGLSLVRPDVGVPEVLTTPALERGEISHLLPAALPGDGRLLFSVWSDEGWSVAILSLAKRTWRTIVPGGRAAMYLREGRIAYLEGATLMVASFDERAGRLVGSATPVVDDVDSFTVSRAGDLLYHPLTPGPTELAWFDREGETELVIPERGKFYQPRLSPDGRHLAVVSESRAGAFTFVLDLERGSRWRPTSEGSINNFPTWSPDGSEIAFNSVQRPPGIYRVSTDGTGAPALLVRRAGEPKLPGAWSPDGRTIIFAQLTREARRDLWTLPLEPGGSPSRLLATSADEHSPDFSPDGAWLAYVSDESGRPEVYVQSFPGPGEKRTISTDGGVEPRFSRDGRELFYLEGNRLMVVPVSLGRSLRADKPRLLVERSDIAPSRFPRYDVAPDGQRFVMVRTAPSPEEPGALRVVLGWVDELEASFETKSRDP